MALKLQDNSTHFKCASCSKILLVKYGRIARVAYSQWDSSTEEKFGYLSYYIMLCDNCYKGELDDGDSDTEGSKKNKKR